MPQLHYLTANNVASSIQEMVTVCCLPARERAEPSGLREIRDSNFDSYVGYE